MDTTPSKIDLAYAESKVIFSICDCTLVKNMSFYTLSREQADKFLKRLRHFEQLTWSQFGALPRENGITSEKHGSDSFKMIDLQNSSAQKLMQQYYFHFRVPIDKFRVFGYQREQLFCITHIDADGEVHHD